jgi:tetratricopeptide (TPR) repeat protein
MKYLFKAIMVFSLVGIVFGQNPDELLNDGIARLNAGELERAEALFMQALDIDPALAPAMVQLAEVNIRKGNMELTQQYLRQAIDSDPTNEDYRSEFTRVNNINTSMAEGSRALNNGLFTEAFTAYKTVNDEFPYFPEAVYSMGLVKFREKDFATAAEYFNRTLDLNPEHENARAAIANVARNTFNDGNNAYRRGDFESALENYKNVLVIDDSFYQAHYQIGVIETRLGNISTAVQAYTRALEINPSFYRGYYALGLAQKRNGNLDDALAALEKSVEINPGYAKAYGAIGDIHKDNDNVDSAINALRTAIQVDGSYVKAYVSLGAIFAEQENYDEARSNLELATSLDNRNSDAWFRLASVYNHLNDCDNAKNAAREALDVKNNLGGAWFELGLAEYCNGSGNKTAALNAFERARNDRTWRTAAEYEIDKIQNPEKYQK